MPVALHLSTPSPTPNNLTARHRGVQQAEPKAERGNERWIKRAVTLTVAEDTTVNECSLRKKGSQSKKGNTDSIFLCWRLERVGATELNSTVGMNPVYSTDRRSSCKYSHNRQSQEARSSGVDGNDLGGIDGMAVVVVDLFAFAGVTTEGIFSVKGSLLRP